MQVKNNNRLHLFNCCLYINIKDSVVESEKRKPVKENSQNPIKLHCGEGALDTVGPPGVSRVLVSHEGE